MDVRQPPEIEAPLRDLSPAEVAEAGRQTAAFLESSAFSVVTTAFRGYQGGQLSILMTRAPSNEGATYADLVGELRGLGRIEPILQGLVASGKKAEAELRAAEEGGQE